MGTTDLFEDSCVKRYFSSIHNIALLAHDEEITLANKKNNGDITARERLITSNLRLVIKIAKSYSGTEVSLIDLIQEGNMGLIRAAEKFDPSMGCRFSTYASYWIKHYISRYIMRAGRSIRIPIRKSELFKKLLAEREHFINENGLEIFKQNTGLNKKSDNFWHSVYVMKIVYTCLWNLLTLPS